MGHFRHHIEESIAINKSRKPEYSRLSQGRSDRIFNVLIASEYASLIPASWYDLRARKFLPMDLFGKEFMSMSAPEIVLQKPVGPFKNFDWKKHHKALSKSKDIKATAWEILQELKETPDYFFMSRHIVESVYRFAHFTPLREAEAKELGLNSPRPLMESVIKLHLMGMLGSYEIDSWCVPLQEEGVPILRFELPDLLKDL